MTASASTEHRKVAVKYTRDAHKAVAVALRHMQAITGEKATEDAANLRNCLERLERTLGRLNANSITVR
jgi:hypothetical protein